MREHGSDSLAYFALRRDKSTFFSASGHSFLAYRVIGRDGDRRRRSDRRPGRAARAVAEFRRDRAREGLARRDRRRERRGAARLRRARFQVDLPRRRGVRRARPRSRSTAARSARCASRSRGSRRPATASSCSARTRSTTSCATSSAPSRTSGAGAGPSAASRWRWTRSSPTPTRSSRSRPAPDGRVGGFLQLVPTPACGGYSLASMRRRRDVPERPDGVPDRGDDRLGAPRGRDARSRSTSRCSRSTCAPTAGSCARCCSGSTGSSSSSGCTASTASSSRHWRRRYFCFERWTDLPLAGLAYLHAESLLTPPGPVGALVRPRRAMRRRSPSSQRSRVAAGRARRAARPRRRRPGPTGRCSFRRRAPRRRAGGDRDHRRERRHGCTSQIVQLDGTVDSAPIYLHDVKVEAARSTTSSS